MKKTAKTSRSKLIQQQNLTDGWDEGPPQPIGLRASCAISLKYKFVWIPIWKNASTSLRAVLARTHKLWNDPKVKFGVRPWQVKMPTILRKHVHLFADFDILAIVRHPVDRFLSAYYHKREVERFCKRYGIPHRLSLADFVRWTCDTPDEQSDPHLRTQNWFLTIRGEQVGDELFRFEELPVCIDKSLERRGIDATFARLASGVKRADADEVGDWTRLADNLKQRLFEHYAVDFERFGYEKELPR